MINKNVLFFLGSLLLIQVNLFSQEILFKKEIDSKSQAIFANRIARDSRGYIWITTLNKGLVRYDGSQFTTFKNDPESKNSLAGNACESLCIDSKGVVWVSILKNGLQSFDPATNTFTHFTHDKNKPSSLGSNKITAILEDHLGNLWIGSRNGLDLYDRKKGSFIHYQYDSSNKSSLSGTMVTALFEDREGTLWVGCGFTQGLEPGNDLDGGLNKFDRRTGKFIRYMHNPNDTASLVSNMVSAIFEDSKGRFWVGTNLDGLHTLDKKTGKFTHYYFDKKDPGKLSRPGFDNAKDDMITSINEDITGAIWISTIWQGINRYDPSTNRVKHYGYLNENNEVLKKDTSEGFNEYGVRVCMPSPDGNIWFVASYWGNLYRANTQNTEIPFFNTKQDESNSLFYNATNHDLWIGTNNGLLRRNIQTNAEKLWTHDPKNSNSLSNNTIYSIKETGKGVVWIGTQGGGLCKFDTTTKIFTRYVADKNIRGSLSDNNVNAIYPFENNIWIANSHGIDCLDLHSGQFTNFSHNENDSTSLVNNQVLVISSDHENNLWAGTTIGLEKFDRKKNIFLHYLPKQQVNSICLDADKILWVGTEQGLYYFNKEKNIFSRYVDPQLQQPIENVLHILEDNNKTLWISTRMNIVTVNPDRNGSKVYNTDNGVKANPMGWGDNYKSSDGRLFIGHYNGYYSFFPQDIKEYNTPPILSFSSFRIGDSLITATKKGILTAAIWDTKELNLAYNQNTFSFEFTGVDFTSSGEKKYLFMLENYDDQWHNLGQDHKAYFFDVDPDHYILKVKCIASDGQSAEISIIINITPPWWKTWWAYSLYAAVAGLSMWAFIVYRSRRFKQENIALEEKVQDRTQQLNQSLQELKATQSQLIQSEKMASLGELTAGIAHEIQNPLNFVNNFSEVSVELTRELVDEVEKGDKDEAKAIANDLVQNLEKINHHGKRADAIVKGMLQHSRSSSGQKEPTDINALCDEYLRLSYHGLRAKDKSFNATFKTDFDPYIGKINIIPQDIGRVIMNLLTNAFYAVNEKQKLVTLNPQPGTALYEPTVSISTKKFNNNIEIKVSDNGNGIPSAIVDKIFQPFFTTKPTGQGTGLGLSLSYDIIKKGHGGELKVETTEAVGSIFTIYLS